VVEGSPARIRGAAASGGWAGARLSLWRLGVAVGPSWEPRGVGSKRGRDGRGESPRGHAVIIARIYRSCQLNILAVAPVSSRIGRAAPTPLAGRMIRRFCLRGRIRLTPLQANSIPAIRRREGRRHSPSSCVRVGERTGRDVCSPDVGSNDSAQAVANPYCPIAGRNSSFEIASIARQSLVPSAHADIADDVDGHNRGDVADHGRGPTRPSFTQGPAERTSPMVGCGRHQLVFTLGLSPVLRE
jgi:hypothetical protein